MGILASEKVVRAVLGRENFNLISTFHWLCAGNSPCWEFTVLVGLQPSRETLEGMFTSWWRISAVS